MLQRQHRLYDKTEKYNLNIAKG